MKQLRIAMLISCCLFTLGLASILSYSQQINELEKLSNNFYYSESLQFWTDQSEIELPKISQNLPGATTLYALVTSDYDLRGLLFTGTYQSPNLLSGRFFTSQEIAESKNYAVVGNEIPVKRTLNNQEVVDVHGQEVLVIGKIGYDFPSRLGRAVFMPLTQRLLDQEVKRYIVDSPNEEANREFVEDQDLWGDVMYDNLSNVTLFNLVDSRNQQLIITIGLLSMLLLSLVTTVQGLVIKKQSEWYYKQSFGYEKSRLYREFLVENTLLVLISWLISLVFVFFNFVNLGRYRHLSLSGLLLWLLVLMISSLLTYQSMRKGGKRHETGSQALLRGKK